MSLKTNVLKTPYWPHSETHLPLLRKVLPHPGSSSPEIHNSWCWMASQNALWPSAHGWHHRAGPTYFVHLEHIHTAHSWFVKTRLAVFACLPIENSDAPLPASHNKYSLGRSKAMSVDLFFITEVEPRALHKTGKALPLNSFALSYRVWVKKMVYCETVTINKDY